MTTHAQDRYQDTVDQLNALLERREAEADKGKRIAMKPAIDVAKDRMCRAHDVASAETDAAIADAPVQLTLESGGRIQVRQQHPAFGGRIKYVAPGESGYDALLARVDAGKSIDERVANAAYAAWGWQGAVRIDYYGAGDDQQAIVTRTVGPAARITIRMATMTVAS